MVTYILMSCGFFTTSGRELEREEREREGNVNEISTLKVNLERRHKPEWYPPSLAPAHCLHFLSRTHSLTLHLYHAPLHCLCQAFRQPHTLSLVGRHLASIFANRGCPSNQT